jgi:integrase
MEEQRTPLGHLWEVTTLRFEDFQLREGHWVIADLRGKGGAIRAIPVPEWVKATVARDRHQHRPNAVIRYPMIPSSLDMMFPRTRAVAYRFRPTLSGELA